jgi:hypothetical protein
MTITTPLSDPNSSLVEGWTALWNGDLSQAAFARLVVDDGWPISEVATRLQVFWPTVKRWVVAPAHVAEQDQPGDHEAVREPANTTAGRPSSACRTPPHRVLDGAPHPRHGSTQPGYRLCSGRLRARCMVIPVRHYSRRRGRGWVTKSEWQIL